MKLISIILGMAGLLGTLQARPQGELSDGKAQSIASLGVRLTPPAGMKTILAGETEPVNYAFPWFQGKDGHINLATVPKSLDDPQLEQAVAKHLAHPKSPFKLQAEVQPIQLKSGIAALRAELTGKTDPGLQVIRIYFKTRQGSTGYIHILPTPGQSQVLETAVRSTLTHGTATPADLPKDLQKNIDGQTGTPQAAETIIPPKINLLLATLKKGMTQDELTTRIKQYYPESYLAESAGGLANQVLTYRLVQGEKVLFELSMHVTDHNENWILKSEKFTLYNSAYNRWVVIETQPFRAENPKP